MKYVKFFIIVAVALFAVNSAAYAEPAAYVENINLDFHSSKYINLGKNISRIFVGSSIITVKQPSNAMNEFVITAKESEGLTTVFVWTTDGARYEYNINISNKEFDYLEKMREEENIERLAAIKGNIIETAIGLPNVKVKQIGNKILLTGTVENTYERNYAIQIAKLYTTSTSANTDSGDMTRTSISGSNLSTAIESAELGNIVNLLKVLHPTQIRLEAQIIAIRPQDTKNLGVLWDGTGSSSAANPGYFYAGESNGNSSKSFRNNPWKWISGHRANINVSIRALITQNKAKLLSRPSIMTMSGEKATIKIGGEIPYRTTDSNGNPTTTFKDYGIILEFNPIVDEQGRIISSINTEVSNMSGESVDGNPILDTRSANTIVTLENGSTMIIGGLMDSSERKTVTKIPLLGNIPIIGEFFKYSSRTKDKQELIIVVTPYIVSADGTSHAGMTDEMRDYYHEGQREQNNLHDVDLNALPPPFEDEKTRKAREKQERKERKAREKEAKEKAKAESEKNKAEDDEDKDKSSWGVEIFGDAF